MILDDIFSEGCVPKSSVNVRAFEFESITMNVLKAVSKLEMENARSLDLFKLTLTEDLARQIYLYNASWKVAASKEKVIVMAKDWWEHFKLRWFPQWAKNLWPVRYTVIKVREVFPDIPVSVRGNSQRFFYLEER